MDDFNILMLPLKFFEEMYEGEKSILFLFRIYNIAVEIKKGEKNCGRQITAPVFCWTIIETNAYAQDLPMPIAEEDSVSETDDEAESSIANTGRVIFIQLI